MFVIQDVIISVKIRQTQTILLRPAPFPRKSSSPFPPPIVHPPSTSCHLHCTLVSPIIWCLLITGKNHFLTLYFDTKTQGNKKLGLLKLAFYVTLLCNQLSYPFIKKLLKKRIRVVANFHMRSNYLSSHFESSYLGSQLQKISIITCP